MEFKDIMASKSDADLVMIVTHLRHEYQPAAVIAAEAEIGSRNFTVERFDAAYEASEYIKQQTQDKATAPLNNIFKILATLLPGITFLLLFMIFKAGGYERKAQEFSRWTIAGFIFYACIAWIIIMNMP